MTVSLRHSGVQCAALQFLWDIPKFSPRIRPPMKIDVQGFWGANSHNDHQASLEIIKTEWKREFCWANSHYACKSTVRLMQDPLSRLQDCKDEVLMNPSRRYGSEKIPSSLDFAHLFLESDERKGVIFEVSLSVTGETTVNEVRAYYHWKWIVVLPRFCMRLSVSSLRDELPERIKPKIDTESSQISVC
jgi:hypothetical protein